MKKIPLTIAFVLLCGWVYIVLGYNKIPHDLLFLFVVFEIIISAVAGVIIYRQIFHKQFKEIDEKLKRAEQVINAREIAAATITADKIIGGYYKMDLPKQRWWRRLRPNWLVLPYLNLIIDLGMIRARTALMCRQYDSMRVEYIVLHVFFIKWEFNFTLYAPVQIRYR